MDVSKRKKPSLLYAVLAFLVPIGLILYGIIGLKVRPPVLPLVAAVTAASLFCIPLGCKWRELQESMFEAAGRIQIAIAILIIVGMLIAAWMASGTIPAIIYWGLKLIAPEYFMVSTMVICAVASLATGTSFGTIGTVGVALLGVGVTLGYPAGMTAGAIVSGAYVGDKMSPVSDTTNIAASVCEVNLFRHIYSMMWTTIPAFVFSMGLYLFLGSGQMTEQLVSVADLNAVLTGIEAHFSLSPIVFLPPLVLFGLAMMRVPVLPVMVASLVAAVAIALMNGHEPGVLMGYMTNGFVSTTGVGQLDSLLSRGGLMSSASTILLCWTGVALGGVFERAGILDVLIGALLGKTRSVLRLVMSALASGYIVLLGTGAQMLAIIIPGRAFSPAFKRANIDPAVLSRCCEDSGTLGSPLIPWSVPAFFTLNVLGVSAYEFGPWAFLCWSVPIFSALCAITGFGIWDGEGRSVRGVRKSGREG